VLAAELTYFNWWGRTYVHIREGKARIQRLEGLMLAARMEIKEIENREEELEAELKGLESAARMYEDIQKELRTRQENEQSLRHNVRDLKRHPVVDAGVKSFHATSRTRSMSNPESPAKAANVSADVFFPGYGITNNHPNASERLPDFDLDDYEEEEMVSSEDGMSENSHEEIANPVQDKWGKAKKSGSGNEKIDITEEKLEEEIVEKKKEKDTSEDDLYA
jgi:hypothetical protein